MKKSKQETIFESLFKLSSLLTIVFLLIIIFFIFSASIQAFSEIGVFNMLFKSEWLPTGSSGKFGLLPMILASIVTTLISLLFAVPIGVATAMYLSKMASGKIKKTIIFVIEVLAGVPSVIYGFFILKTIVVLIYENNQHIEGVSGNSLLAAIVVLTIMALPTIITLSTTALNAVDSTYESASLALGANKIQTIFKVHLRAAKSGIMASIVLGAGKVLGETMAVMLVSGNTPLMPFNLLFPIRTLTANIATEMGYAQGVHQSALFASGVVLFCLIMILNVIMLRINKKVGF